MEEEPDPQAQIEAIFEEAYGIPLRFAKQLAEMDSPVGDYWRKVFEYLKGDHEKKEGDDVSQTD